MKKRLIEQLYAESWPDTQLILDEFGFPGLVDDYPGQESYIRARLNDVSDRLLTALDRYFNPDLYLHSDESREQDPPMSMRMAGQANTPFSSEEQSRIADVVAEVLK
jgi:hypothetical protein